jgi:hypothetical protein
MCRGRLRAFWIRPSRADGEYGPSHGLWSGKGGCDFSEVGIGRRIVNVVSGTMRRLGK